MSLLLPLARKKPDGCSNIHYQLSVSANYRPKVIFHSANAFSVLHNAQRNHRIEARKLTFAVYNRKSVSNYKALLVRLLDTAKFLQNHDTKISKDFRRPRQVCLEKGCLQFVLSTRTCPSGNRYVGLLRVNADTGDQ